jgi:hypothetical protein
MNDEWVVRIGRDAAALQRRAGRILLATVLVFVAYILVSIMLGAFFRSNIDARNVIALSDLVVAIPLFGIGFLWYRRTQAAACRAAADFVHLRRHTGESTFPRIALRNPTMFDNLMVPRNIGTGGRYKAHPSESWTSNTDGRFGSRGL